MHILLIEPNVALAATYTAAFAHAGWQVSVAGDPQAAIDAADAKTPDVVVLELQLPAHSGIEFLHEFRSYAEWRHTPIIINTFIPANRMAVYQEVLRRDMGVCAIFAKPQTRLEILTNAVRRAAVYARA